MRYILALPLIAMVALGTAFYYDRLRTFDTFVPKDAGGERVAEGVAYGVHPLQQLDIYAPTQAPDNLRPVLFWLYGGSWNSGTRSGYSWLGRALAAQGFVVVIADYRLVPEVRFPRFVEDSAAAFRWVRGNIGEYGGDGTRIVVGGHSAGAYNAAMLAHDPQWLGDDRAAVAGFVGLAGPYDFYPFDTDSTIAAFGQWPEPLETQPVTYADETAPPALLLTGDIDTTVKPRNSEALLARLTDAGVEAEMLRYEGIDHVEIITAISRPFRDEAPVLEDISRFVRDVTRDDGEG